MSGVFAGGKYGLIARSFFTETTRAQMAEIRYRMKTGAQRRYVEAAAKCRKSAFEAKRFRLRQHTSEKPSNFLAGLNQFREGCSVEISTIVREI
jgi:hypothetical protein